MYTIKFGRSIYDMRDRCRTWARSMRSLKWAERAINREIGKVHSEMFSTEGFGRWTPLAPATMLMREIREGYYGEYQPESNAGPDGPILYWAGILDQSLTADQKGPWGIRYVAGLRIIWGTQHPAARELNNGRRDMPGRPLLAEAKSRDAVVALLNKAIPAWLNSGKNSPPKLR